MKVGEAIDIVKWVLKTDPSGEGVRWAIKFTGDLFLRETACAITSGTLTATLNDPTIVVTDDLPDFAPERWIGQEITTSGYAYYRVHKRTYKVVQDLYRHENRSGYTQFISFRPDGVGVLYPSPDVAYTYRVYYVPTLGDISNNDTTLVIPDEYCHDWLWFGASAAAGFNDPSLLFQNPAWQRFTQEVIPKVADAVSTDGMTQLSDPDWPAEND